MYSVLVNNVFETLNLIYRKYVAELNLSGNDIRLLSTDRVLVGFAVEDFHHIMQVQKCFIPAATGDMQYSLQLSISSKIPWIRQGLLSCHHSIKYSPHPFPPPKLFKIHSN
jgi:hypothetical protein